MKFLVFSITLMSLSAAIGAEVYQDQSRRVLELSQNAKSLFVESYELAEEVNGHVDCSDKLLEKFVVYNQLLLKIAEDEEIIFKELISIDLPVYNQDKWMIEEALYHDFNFLRATLENLKALAKGCLEKERENVGSATFVYPLKS